MAKTESKCYRVRVIENGFLLEQFDERAGIHRKLWTYDNSGDAAKQFERLVLIDLAKKEHDDEED